MKIAYQGIKGSYSESCAKEMYPGCETISCKTFDEVFSKAKEDESAGVSLDEEAAALIQFQQAFSANARIIQTARELFESLMVVISK